LFQHYGDFNASIQGDAINAANAILESLAVQADTVLECLDKCWCDRARETLENVKVGINQSVLFFRDV
jgi:hypothetical protein